jgi:hypothetical protein
VLLFAAAANAQDAPVRYNPSSGTQDNPTSVGPSSKIEVFNDISLPMLVIPRASDGPPETGTPLGDPFPVPANGKAEFTVPNTPALLGMPFELDPNTQDDQLLGH